MALDPSDRYFSRSPRYWNAVNRSLFAKAWSNAPHIATQSEIRRWFRRKERKYNIRVSESVATSESEDLTDEEPDLYGYSRDTLETVGYDDVLQYHKKKFHRITKTYEKLFRILWSQRDRFDRSLVTVYEDYLPVFRMLAGLLHNKISVIRCFRRDCDELQLLRVLWKITSKRRAVLYINKMFKKFCNLHTQRYLASHQIKNLNNIARCNNYSLLDYLKICIRSLPLDSLRVEL